MDMSVPQVRLLQIDESLLLPQALACSIGFVGLDSWSKFVHEVYDFPVYRFVSENNGVVDGWLALVRVKHPIFGDYLATSPFGSYGGFAHLSVASRNVLLEKARSLGSDLGVDYVNVRFDGGDEPTPDGWIQHPNYCTYLVDLAPEPDQMMSTFSSDHRNHIRKSFRKGFSVQFGHLDLLDDAYEGLAHSMHELGSPYHSRSYLLAMAQAMGDNLEFVVAYGPDSKIAGAGVFVSQDDRVTNLHANILRKYRADYAGELLYWSVIERYCHKGFKVLDLGRSLIGSGNETFKMKWKPRRQLLAYWYALIKGHELPDLNQKNPKFQIAIWTWKRLPAFLVRWLGSYLIRGVA